jgi:AraC family transcriptional regulator
MAPLELGSGQEILFTSSTTVDIRSRWIRPLTRGRVFIATYRTAGAPLGEAYSQSGLDAYLALIHLQPFGRHTEWNDGQPVDVEPAEAGALRLIDLRHSWSTELHDPFHALAIFIPRQLFNELGVGRPRRADSPWAPGTIHMDSTLAHLLEVLAPLVDNEDDRLFADQILNAMAVHLAQTYVGNNIRVRYKRQGLQPWQLRRVTTLMTERIADTMSLDELAGTCGISQNHFGRMFRESTGQSPFRWLLQQRIEKAKSLLETTDLNISHVALSVGFANQSHFTHYFSKAVGLTPAIYRRTRKIN